MQKKLTMGLFLLLIVILGLVLTSLLSSKDSSMHIELKSLSPSQGYNKEPSKHRTWSESLAGSKDAKFFFPVNELFIKIDLKKYTPQKIKSYKLVVDRADQYSLFCIVQTLSQMELPFVIEKRDGVILVYVASKTEDLLKDAIERLREYDIESKIVEEWL